MLNTIRKYYARARDASNNLDLRLRIIASQLGYVIRDTQVLRWHYTVSEAAFMRGVRIDFTQTVQYYADASPKTRTKGVRIRTVEFIKFHKPTIT